MRALDTCDFCGADAVGAFEVVPPELEPTEREQRRVLLCQQCQERLETLLEPLLARAGAPVDVSDGTDAAAGVNATGGALEREGTQAPAPESDEAGSNESEPEDPEPDAASPTDSDRDERPTAADAPSAPTGGITAESNPLEDGPEEGITVDPDDDGPTEDAPATGAVESDPDEAETDAGETDVGTTADGGKGKPGDAEAEARSDEKPTSGRSPKAYGRVLRLLGNRELPIERAAAEALAAGAYDLERHEVDDVIEYALERGELVETNGELDRP